MGRNDISFVPPQTFFGKELLVGYQEGGSRDVDSFSTINDAIDYVAGLPSIDQPAKDNWYVIKLHPSAYPEKIWLPDFFGLIGTSSQGTILSGDVTKTDMILSLGVGFVGNLGVLPVGPTSFDDGIFIRNSNSGYTIEEGDYGAIGAGDTLIVDHASTINTITFAGGESTAAAIAAAITAQGTTVKGVVRGTHAEIRPVSSASALLTVKSTGTANAALGFSTTADTIYGDVGTELVILDDVVISKFITTGIRNTDLGGGAYLLDRPFITNCTQGIFNEEDCSINMTNPILFFNSDGIVVADNSDISVFGGFSSGNGNNDLVLQGAGSQVFARNFAYQKRSGIEGDITPSGSRMTFEFNLAGNIGVGTQVDGIRLIPFDATIESVSMVRGIAGASGTTIVDVNQIAPGGAVTTLYTTQGNRPSVDATDGDFASELATLPDVLILDAGDGLSIDVDQKETGLPQDLNLVVTVVIH